MRFTALASILSVSTVLLQLTSLVVASPVSSLIRTDYSYDNLNPLVDSFYKAPKDIKKYHNGHVLRRRAVETIVGNSSTVAHAHQILFRSTDNQGNAIAAVATVIAPKKAAKHKGKLGVVSIQIHEDAVSLSCSNSWGLVQGSSSVADLANGTDIFAGNWALQNGYYVVYPDSEGPASSFIVGRTEAHITLDGIRGTISSEKLPSTTRVALYGYSGGAHATNWAAQLAASYASDLHFIGSAHGGTPIDAEHDFTFLNAGPYAGLSGSGLVGLMSGYPEFKKYILNHFSANGTKVLEALQTNGTCIDQLETAYAYTNFTSFFTKPDLLQSTTAQKVYKQETLLRVNASFHISTVKQPRLIYHASLDEIVPLDDDQAYVKEQCSTGGNIQYLEIPNAGHVQAQLYGFTSAMRFLSQLFKGETPKVKCGVNGTALSFDSAKGLKVLGSTLVAELQATEAGINAELAAYGLTSI